MFRSWKSETNWFHEKDQTFRWEEIAWIYCREIYLVSCWWSHLHHNIVPMVNWKAKKERKWSEEKTNNNESYKHKNVFWLANGPFTICVWVHVCWRQLTCDLTFRDFWKEENRITSASVPIFQDTFSSSLNWGESLQSSK